MGQTLYFEIPTDNTTSLAKLIQSVPDNWAWVDGVLQAPQRLVYNNKVASHAGYVFSRFFTTRPTIGVLSGKKEDLAQIVIDNKLPEFIRFDEGGFESNLVTLAFCKEIAERYICREYLGNLAFYSGHRHNNKFDNPAHCDIKMRKWRGLPIGDESNGLQPPRVKVEWNEKFGGSSELVQSIVDFCRSRGLKEYVPSEEVRSV